MKTICDVKQGSQIKVYARFWRWSMDGQDGEGWREGATHRLGILPQSGQGEQKQKTSLIQNLGFETLKIFYLKGYFCVPTEYTTEPDSK